MQSPLYTWIIMMLVPPPACVANGVGFITPHSTEEESESQGAAGSHGARSHNSGDLWVLPLSSLSSSRTAQEICLPMQDSLPRSLSRPELGIWWANKMLLRSQEKRRKEVWVWSYTYFSLTWKAAAFRYYFVLCFFYFYLSVCPRNLTISVLREF